MRTLVLCCPEWPVVAAGAVPDQPLAVVHANRVIASSPAARFEGVTPGLRRREAQGRCPGLDVVAADPARDARAFEPLAVALDVLTPRIEMTRPGTIAFATHGPSRYFGGDDALIERVVALATKVLGPRVDVAGTPVVGVADSAFAARRTGTRCAEDVQARVIPQGGTAEFLAPLPTTVFPVIEPELGFDDLVDLLARLGVRTLGKLAALPASDVAARFGPLGALAHRLANGRDGRLLDERPVPPDLAVSAELDPPAERVDHAAFVAKALADELQERLDTRGLACTRIAIEAETEHGEHLVRLWRHEGGLTPAASPSGARRQLDGWLHSTQRPTSGITLLRPCPTKSVRPAGTRWASGRSHARRRTSRTRVGAARSARRRRGVAAEAPRRFYQRERGCDTRRRSVANAARVSFARRKEQFDDADGGLIRFLMRDRHGTPVVVSGRGLLSCPPATIESNGRNEDVTAWSGPWVFDERWWAAEERRVGPACRSSPRPAPHLLVLEQRRWWIEATYD